MKQNYVGFGVCMTYFLSVSNFLSLYRVLFFIMYKRTMSQKNAPCRTEEETLYNIKQMLLSQMALK